MTFTQKKFQSLSKESQHKKVSELLKKIYYNFDQKLLKKIQIYEEWMSAPWTNNPSVESIANSFHKHLKHSGRGVSEHSLLIKKHDRTTPKEDWLDVDIYLDRLRSAHNIGSILRTTEAFRLGRILFSVEMATTDHPQVTKTSMGASSLVKTKIIKSLEAFEKRPLIAIETHQKAIPLNDFIFPENFTLILGNEEFGVSEELLEKADHIVEVPLFGQKNSLNVAVCFSILAYKIRQDLKFKVKE